MRTPIDASSSAWASSSPAASYWRGLKARAAALGSWEPWQWRGLFLLGRRQQSHPQSVPTDALFIAGTKGLIAGLTKNLILAVILGAALPTWPKTLEAMGLGLAGYGVSLVLFVLALRGLGSARTGAYCSTAPFIGAAIAIAGFHESPSVAFWVAAILMAAGVWLHLTERHEHEHNHEALVHTHSHRHDSHHQHMHDFEWDGREPHTHEHRHDPMTHTHPHYPDIHHRHGH